MNREEFMNEIKEIGNRIHALINEFEIENVDVPIVVFAAGLQRKETVEHYVTAINGHPLSLYQLLTMNDNTLVDAISSIDSIIKD